MNKLILYLLFLFSTCSTLLCQIESGKITFERKTNLYKKFKNSDAKNWIKEADKIKIDFFELYFNDTCSVFKPQESELRETMSWATAKNVVYQNFNTKSRYIIKNIWGEELHVRDSLFTRVWKITDSDRKIAGFNCRKAVWQANDSTRIYAWFSYDLVSTTGPESFYGLPGTILGIATEDGGVVYFAKKVELIKPDVAVLTPPKKKKVNSFAELKKDMDKQFGKEKWYKSMMQEQFGIW